MINILVCDSQPHWAQPSKAVSCVPGCKDVSLISFMMAMLKPTCAITACKGPGGNYMRYTEPFANAKRTRAVAHFDKIVGQYF